MRILVVGAGKSGIAVVRHAVGMQAMVALSEAKSISARELAELTQLGVEFEHGGHSLAILRGADLVVTSPGVPPTNMLLQEAERTGVPVISELEYGYRHLPNGVHITAITGTNGKTTTTSLIGYLYGMAGLRVHVVGNIGTPLTDALLGIQEGDYVVVEASSYQLDRIDTFRPNIALLLNITPDHLAYHGSMEHYIQAKYRITSNQSPDDFLVLNADNEVSAACASVSRATILTFGHGPQQQGAWFEGGVVTICDHRSSKEEVLMTTENIGLPGVHNVYNSLAAALAARACEISNENIRDSLAGFAGVEHRLESVGIIDGVEYVNDSKATNVNATWYALGAFRKPLVWIAGGRGDSNDYSSLDELVRARVVALVAIGEEAEALFNHFCTMTRCVKASSMDEAVKSAQALAPESSIVLFSPACKSFDWFMSYEHRGHVFKQCVQQL